MSGVPSSRVKLLRWRSVWAAAKTSGVTISSSSRWKLPFGELYVVEGLELLAEVSLERGPGADFRAVDVLQVEKFLDEPCFKLAFRRSHGDFQIGA